MLLLCNGLLEHVLEDHYRVSNPFTNGTINSEKRNVWVKEKFWKAPSVKRKIGKCIYTFCICRWRSETRTHFKSHFIHLFQNIFTALLAPCGSCLQLHYSIEKSITSIIWMKLRKKYCKGHMNIFSWTCGQNLLLIWILEDIWAKFGAAVPHRITPIHLYQLPN